MTEATPQATTAPSAEDDVLSGTYVPSASEFVRAQVETYEGTGGQEANTFLDTPSGHDRAADADGAERDLSRR
jgi:hypothetical protein